MRHLAVLLLLFAFGATLPACAQKAPGQKTTKKVSQKAAKPTKPAAAKPGKEAGPVITFERTPCFGTCPGYSMKVFADGRVAYEGRRAVPLMGPRELRLPAATVAEMLRMAREAQFEQFQESYSRGVTDLPSTIVAVRQPNGQLKTVTVEGGAPENVQALFAYLGNQFDMLAQLPETAIK